jgi:hypothetical protein
MRNAAQRLERIAEALDFSLAGSCACSGRPQFAVTTCDVDGHDLPSDPAELSKVAFTCPVHGMVGPELHVRMTRFSTPDGRTP